MREHRVMRGSGIGLFLAVVSLSLPALAGDKPVSLDPVAELLALDAPARAERLADWRLEAGQRMAEADRAVWSAVREPTRACRTERRETVRRFLRAYDTFAPVLLDSDATGPQHQTAAGVLVRTWTPALAVEPDAPCEPGGPADGRLRITTTAPPGDGLADLPELLVDDPLTVAMDVPGRRLLKR